MSPFSSKKLGKSSVRAKVDITNTSTHSIKINLKLSFAYLIALAGSLGTKIVYSMDEELTKVKDIVVVNPFPEDKLREYHEWIKAKKA